MNNLTVSLETAKKLEEAGWEKETYFYRLGYIPIINPNPQMITTIDKIVKFQEGRTPELNMLINKETYSAPTLSEILGELQKYFYLTVDRKLNIVSAQGRVTIEMFLHFSIGTDYKVYYTDAYENVLKGFEFINTNPAEACALLYLQLKQQNLIK